ncbi:MAG: class I SAM-dependent methyltransferase [Planctomycetota bacterium]
MPTIRSIPLLRRWLCVALLLAGCAGTERQSVRPGINKEYLDPALNVAKLDKRFSAESREVFTERARVAALLELKPGMAVADIGAGTGIYLELFATAVGPTGKIFAVEIAPPLVDHLRELARVSGWSQVEVVLCREDSVELPNAAIDIAFLCDTYHHFEYPQATLASIHRALRPGGRLVVVDFIREAGVSRAWVLDHVRAGEAVFAAEIEAAGFAQLPKPDTSFLMENYVLMFQKR